MGCGNTHIKEENSLKGNKSILNNNDEKNEGKDPKPENKKEVKSKKGKSGKKKNVEYTEEEKNMFLSEDTMTEDEVYTIIENNGYSRFHRVFDQNPVDDIMNYCKKNGKVFRSPYFTFADYDKECKINIDWVRPRKLNPDCELFLDGGPGLGDCCQGGIGNCGVCAMAGFITALPPKIFMENIYPTFLNPYGVYSVRVFVGGKWRYSLIDDYLPVEKNSLQLWSWHSPEYLEMWPMLLEKHMANMANEYNPWPKNFWIRDEEYPSPSMYDYGYVFNCNTNHNLLPIEDRSNWKIFEENLGKSAIACQGFDKTKESEKAGLVGHHGYLIFGAASIPEKDIYLLKCRNPWGFCEWNGDWSDKSNKWEEYAELKHFKPENKDDGIFWMERKDLMKFGLKSVPLIFLAHESLGFTNHVVIGEIDPIIYNDISQSPAVHITISGDCEIFFSPECEDYRYTQEDIRIFADIYKADGDFISKEHFITTKGLDHDKGRERPDHFYPIKKGEYIFVFRPSVEFTSNRNFNCRISTNKPSSIKQLVKHSDFQVSNKNFTDINDLMVCCWAAYGSMNATKIIFDQLSCKGVYVMPTGNHNEILGDPDPGLHKYMVISSVFNKRQTVNIYKEGAKFEFKLSSIQSGGRDLKKDESSYLDGKESIIWAQYGGLNVQENVQEKLSAENTLNFVLDSNMFDCPLKDLESRALIVCYSSGGHLNVTYWNDQEEVKLGC